MARRGKEKEFRGKKRELRGKDNYEWKDGDRKKTVIEETGLKKAECQEGESS